MGFEFSTFLLESLDYYEYSFCHDEFYYNDLVEYCDVKVGFNSAACTAKIATSK